jgi:hypothetical protein
MTASLAVLILNYKRPQNIGRLVRAAREALPDAPIFIFDQSERRDFCERKDIPWSDVWVQSAEVNQGAGARLMLASSLPFDLFISIDDDTLLTARQIGRLAELLQGEPDRAHGVWGQRLEWNGDEVTFRNAMHRIDGAVSTLNQAYAFSRTQAVAALALAARLGFPSWRDVGNIDDFLLSCASPKPPLCHDLGDIALCPTCDEPGIALWRSEGFLERRIDVARKLMAAQAIAVFSPLVYEHRDEHPPTPDAGPS